MSTVMGGPLICPLGIVGLLILDLPNISVILSILVYFPSNSIKFNDYLYFHFSQGVTGIRSCYSPKLKSSWNWSLEDHCHNLRVLMAQLRVPCI